MSSSWVLAQLGVLTVVAVAATVQAAGRWREAETLGLLVPGLLAIYALAHVLFVVFLWFNHAGFPLNLEAMELTVFQHHLRALSGQQIYVEPTSSFVALAYTPLYYYLTVPFVWVLGSSLLTLRVVAVLGMLGSGLVIYLAVRRSTHSQWWGLMAVGLSAAGYRVMDCYLDNAHSDSWLLFTILLGCYLIDLKRSQLTDLAGLFLVVLAFWFKQGGALFGVGAVLFLTLRGGWRRSWSFWLIALVLGPILYLMAPRGLLGPYFHDFTWQVPSQWTVLNLATIRRLGSIVFKSYFLLATVGLFASAVALWRSRLRSNIWYFLLPFAVLSGLLGALDAESNNNVFIPMGVWFIITGALGLRQFLERVSSVPRWNLHILALVLSFALLVYSPLSVIVPHHAMETYQDLVSYLESLDGKVYAPWIGQLPTGYEFYPAVHWVPMTDLVRGAGSEGLASFPESREAQKLLGPVLRPEGRAYLLMNIPLEDDPALAFLGDRYVLATDLGPRFSALSTLPRRYYLGWPRYLYQYTPGEAAAQSLRRS